MKKITAAAAIAIGGISTVQAATSVTLYGMVDAGIAYQRASGTWNGESYKATKFGLVSGGQSQSRWGITGVEDLGDGWSAVFQIENGFDLQNGQASQAGRLFGRQATVGLKSDVLGTLEFGRQANIASKYGNPIVDPFNAGYTQSAAGTSFSSMNTTRYDNMALYRSPDMGGFQFGLGYSFAVDGTQSWKIDGHPTDDGKAVTTGLSYKHGPFSAFASYDQVKFDASSVTVKEWIVGGAYDFDVAKISAAFGKTQDGWFAGRNFGTLSTGTFVMAEGLDVNSYLVALAIPAGNGQISASWQMADPRSGATASTGVGFVGDDLSKQQVYSLGYMYNLSKRTNFYVYGSYARHALFQEDLDATVLSMGIRHRF